MPLKSGDRNASLLRYFLDVLPRHDIERYAVSFVESPSRKEPVVELWRCVLWRALSDES